MIASMEDTERVAVEIEKLSQGDCELCGAEIGGNYVCLGQIIPRDLDDGLTIEVLYQVACAECFRHMDALVKARRSLHPDFEGIEDGAGV